MSWREMIARREERREREERDMPPHTRSGLSDDPTGLAIHVVIGAACVAIALVAVWQDGDSTSFWILVGLVALAALLAYVVARIHRSKSRKELRGEPEAGSVRWEVDRES